MNQTIEIQKIEKNQNTITVSFFSSTDLACYFKENIFLTEYSEDVSKTPDSIAILPFVCNVLPIVWLTGATLKVEEIDKDFILNCSAIRKGYEDMYPMLQFRGRIEANRIVENSTEDISESNSAAFFSGGVDAFATLIAHIKEKPILITLWGSDIQLDDTDGWEIVKNHTLKTCSDFGLEKVFIRTNFRTFLDECALSKLVVKSNDGWWHGFQHGIGLIGHAAPIIWKNNIKTVYIASSFTKKDKGKVTCASDPTIDNNVKIAGCRTIHDQYDYERIEKVGHIVDFAKRTNIPIDLRVCWITRGGRNCCRCEKCLRTMFEIFAFGEDPHKYGFNYSRKNLQKAKNIVLSQYGSVSAPAYWREIQDKVKNINNKINLPPEIEWIHTINFEKERKSFRFKLYMFRQKLKSISSRIIKNYLK